MRLNCCDRHGRLYTYAQDQTRRTISRFFTGIVFAFCGSHFSGIFDTNIAPVPHKEVQTKTIVIFAVSFIICLKLIVCLWRLPQAAQVSKAVNSSVMPVGPARLKGITANELKSRQLKTFFVMGHKRTRNVTEHVRFAATRCARTRAPQQFQFEIRFRAIVPHNGQLVANLLDVCWL